MAHRPQNIIKIMATEPPFDLNAAFENWRNELASQPQLSPDDRRELERHLVDSTAELRQRGLNEEEAFWLARRRTGQPQQLAEEFGKAEPLKVWRERAFWMAATILAFQIWRQLSTALLGLLSGPNFNLDSLLVFEIVVFCLPVVLAIILIATGRMGWLIKRSAAVIRSHARLAFTAVLLAALSSFLTVVATLHFPVRWHGKPRMSQSLLTLTMENMMVPLIFIILLCLFMPKRAKTPKHA